MSTTITSGSLNTGNCLPSTPYSSVLFELYAMSVSCFCKQKKVIKTLKKKRARGEESDSAALLAFPAAPNRGPAYLHDSLSHFSPSPCTQPNQKNLRLAFRSVCPHSLPASKPASTADPDPTWQQSPLPSTSSRVIIPATL